MADYNLIQEAIDLYYINNHLGEKQIELRKSEFNAAFVIAHDKKIRSLYLMGMSKADISFNLGIDVSKVVDVIEGRKKHKLPEFIVVPEV